MNPADTTKTPQGCLILTVEVVNGTLHSLV